MKIVCIKLYQIDYPLIEGRYSWADGKYVEVFDSTIVEIETDTGEVGIGEICPLGPFYLPAFAAGARAGIKELAPHLIGLDPTALGIINDVMDRALLGHPYVKSAIDMACWDLLGKRTGLSICDLMGGRQGQSVSLYRAISQMSADMMAQNLASYKAAGYTRFQLKVGGKPADDIARIKACVGQLAATDTLVADANTGWLAHEALQVVAGVRDEPVYIEQPCRTYAECLCIRRATTLPFVLDENIDGIPALMKGHVDGAMDIINLKISKVGGLTKARQIRDLCVSLGIPMTIEDTWGGDVTTAAIAHLAHSTPERFRFSSTDFNSYINVSVAKGAPSNVNGTMSAPMGAGLGLILDKSVVTKMVAEIR